METKQRTEITKKELVSMIASYGHTTFAIYLDSEDTTQNSTLLFTEHNVFLPKTFKGKRDVNNLIKYLRSVGGKFRVYTTYWNNNGLYQLV